MEQLDLLRRVVAALEGMGVTYMLVGSYGSGAWGEPRLTRDIDLVASLSADDAEPLIRAFPLPEFYVSIDAVREAIRREGQFNVIHPTSGNKVDFIVAGGDLRARTALSRRQAVDLGAGLRAYVASPEDVILGKMEFYREGGSEKHLRDVAGILKVSGDCLDRGYVSQWAGKLGLSDIWQAVQRRVSLGGGKR